MSVQVTFLCLLIGIPAGLALALGTSSKSRAVRHLSVVLVEIGRGAPALILLQVTYFGLPDVGLTLSSMAASVLGLGYCTASYTSEIIRGALQAVPGVREKPPIALA